MAREINLVPDIKGEMIKALKLRNFIFFICIVVAAASVGAALLFAVIAGGQQAVVDGKKNTLSMLSQKINNYSDLSDFLTVRDQLSNLSTISSNKKLLSRTFNILSALLPKGADTITLSELNIDLAKGDPTISFDAQANAGEPPYIDYNVLDAFKKSMAYMRYDYGNYVDRSGNTIPAYCIIENGVDGATFSDAERGYYAYWLINGEGCNPSTNSSGEPITTGYTIEEYNGNQVVRIWRTPQTDEWYQKKYMELDGRISEIEHFESQCTTYTGVINSVTNVPKWTKTNDKCLLVSNIDVPESSNGRDAEDSLVLRFSAIITLSPDVYNFNNHHVLALGPSGRYNVTDSYIQIQSMFAERAKDCAEGDAQCSKNNINKAGGN
jgi:hypothetical protein